MTAPTPSPAVAALDIGSNSIKVLVAQRGAQGGITVLTTRTIEARISAGISRGHPRLTDEAMLRGVDAIQSLLATAEPYAPRATVLVATSAVRDAENGAEFQARVQAATGQQIRILSGLEEANLIGRGLTSDPGLSGASDFYVFDLGGGSLECLAFRGRRVEAADSLRLGCVRLTEKFLADSSAPISEESRRAIAGHTHELLGKSAFSFCLPAGALAVGTGGTMTTIRLIRAARAACPMDQTSAIVAREQLAELYSELASQPLATRRQVPGLPAARADVFPTGLATLLALAERGGIKEFRHSLHNLRFGLAAEALDRVDPR